MSPRLEDTILGYVARKGAKQVLAKLVDNGGSARFSELYSSTVFTTPATLAARLKELSDIKAIKKVGNPNAFGKGGTVNPGEPLNLHYEITDLGKKILDIIKPLDHLEQRT